MSIGWSIAYFAVGVWVFGAGCGWAWRQTVREDGDVGDVCAVAFIAFGAGLMWPALPLLYAVHLALEWTKRREAEAVAAAKEASR